MIKKIGLKYVVVAESGRKMGSYATKKEATRRLKQIEFFKHLSENRSLRQTLGKKTLIEVHGHKPVVLQGVRD
ncbi:MAG: hypothetical protein HYW77_01350 [Parcubacteria group bacterium]|nr:hypothetical protein [Parcubacteria group bacterium]